MTARGQRRTLVIVNPAAGRWRARRALPHVRELFQQKGWAADFVASKSTSHLREIAARAAAGGYSDAAALGGDGTFHHLVEATFGLDLTLGFFPAGGGNDIATGLSLPASPLAAAEAYLRLRPRTVDILRLRLAGGNSALCLGAGGMGLDAEAARLANGVFRRLPGAARYIAGALWTYPCFPIIHLVLRPRNMFTKSLYLLKD